MNKEISLIETANNTLLLINTFLANTIGYFILFVPLVLVYEIYKKFTNEIKSKIGNGLLLKFLNLYTFGNVIPRDSQINIEETKSADNKPLLPQTNPDLNNNQTSENETRKNKLVTFLFCFFGLQLSFVIWGLMQERIIKFGYSKSESIDKKDFSRFKNSQFLVLSNRLAGFLLACVILLVFNKGDALKQIKCRFIRFRKEKFSKLTSFKQFAPLFICSYSSLSNVLSSWYQYESLKYVSFTSQLLAKSSKSVFVMITGKVVSNKSYKPYEYVCVGIIGFGIFMFSDLGETNLSKTGQMIQTTFPGIICLVGYLITDSFTSTWQDNLIRNYFMSSVSLMLLTNFYSSAYTFVSLLYQGELLEPLSFLYEHTDITLHVILLSATSAIGQIFIFVTIQEFGALVFSLMMTTRQVLSILLSSIVFKHSLSVFNYFGIFLIFFALFLQHYFKLENKTKKNTANSKTKPLNFI